MKNVAILGYGTVGSGVAEVIRTNQESINQNAGEEVRLKYVLDLRDFPGDPVESVLVHDFNQIVNDPEVAVVVETLGGLKPAYEFTKQSLMAGKNVCTSNKELIAEHGVELIKVAHEHGVNYLFEASCGGGIPIIRPLNTSLTADDIDEVSGILNGTTNYILTAMATDGQSYEDALSDAQKNGYAELHPEADVEGYDAGRKIAILSSLAYGCHIDYHDVYTEGITNITPIDIRYAKRMGASIKLLATSRKTDTGYYAMVSPVLVGPDSPLFSVNGVFNAIFIHGNVLGDAMFYGSGAGKLPTASAVVADIVDCVRNHGRQIMAEHTTVKLPAMPLDDVENRFFVRVNGSLTQDMDHVHEVFGEVEDVVLPDAPGEYGFLTQTMTESDFRVKEKALGNVIARIRARV